MTVARGRRTRAGILSSSQKSMRQQIREAREHFPARRCGSDAVIEAGVEDQDLACAVAHRPKIANGIAAQKGLRKMPDLSRKPEP